MRLRIATRRSALALAQTRMIAAAIAAKHPGLEVEEVQVVTEGDRVQDRPLAAIGGKGLFIKELEAALLDGRADLAVHSMKDLPADLADGLVIAAVPARESPWDLLVTTDARPLASLARGARVGTSSLRRRVQLLAARPDLAVELLRGNVDTRLRKLREGAYDAIVVAEAGVKRLGIEATGVRLERELVPAIAQGALALEARAGDEAVGALVAALDDGATAIATRAEREVMRALGGSCVTPIGAHAVVANGAITMRGFLATEDGAGRAWAEDGGPSSEPERVGRSLATELRARLDRALG